MPVRIPNGRFRIPVRLGWEESERQNPQDVTVDLRIRFPDPPDAVRTDEIAGTVNYAVLAERIRHLVSTGEFRLLAGVNAPEVSSGQAEPNGSDVLHLPTEVKAGLKLQQLVMIDQYGTDAFRFTLAAFAAQVKVVVVSANERPEDALAAIRDKFGEPPAAAALDRLDPASELAERIEVLAARFARLQDHLGEKLLPRWLQLQGEPPVTMLDTLNRAEKLRLVHDALAWAAWRKLRNRLVHEYLQEPATLADAVRTTLHAVPLLLDVLTGKVLATGAAIKPQGKLPFALANNLQAIIDNAPDAPGYPAKDTLFPFVSGLSY